MNIYVNFRSAWKSIKNNRKKSILTMIGIIIGIASVITILAIGRGFEKQTIENLTQAKSKNIEIQVNFSPTDNSLYETNTDFFQETDLSTISKIAGVKKAFYVKVDESQLFKEVMLDDKKENKQMKLVPNKGQSVMVGRTLTKQDNETLNKVVIVDSNLAKKLYKNIDGATGKGVEIENQLFTIVGVFEGNEEENLFSIGSTNIEMPRKTYYRYFDVQKDTSSITVTLETGTSPDKVTTKIIDTLKDQGSSRALGDYSIFDTSLLTEGVGNILSTITYFISAVAGISLFIAGVGVMNMMYISVSERTKEIGIRRALGATKQSIKLQFLLEGVILTLSGGIVGYILGMILAYSIGALIKVHVSIDVFTIILAVGISSLIGLFFSVMPASEAAKKDLIDILG